MSEQSALAFAERVTNDEAFRDRLAAAPDRAARQAIAQEEGYDLGPADVPAIKAALGMEDISDDDLERIAGQVGSPTGDSDEPLNPTATFAIGIHIATG